MNCSDVAERLESYVAGDLAELERQAVAAHLATCLACTAEHAALSALAGDLRSMSESFRPRLLPPQVTLDRVVAMRSRRRRIVLLVAAALTLGALAAIAASTVPAAAERSPFPVGGQIRALRDANDELESALHAAADDQARLSARLKARAVAVQTPVLPSTADAVHRAPGLDEVVAGYFSARARAVMPTAVGDAARASLARYCVAGSQALVAGRSYATGARASLSDEDAAATRDATAVIEVLTLDQASDGAVLLVQPVSWTSWAQADDGNGTRLWRPRYEIVKEYSHKVTAVRQGPDRWRLTTVATADPAAGETLRAGSAPAKVVEEARQGVDAGDPPRSSAVDPIPSGARAVVRRFVALVNAAEYDATADLFADGRGIDERGLDPYWTESSDSPVLKLRDVRLTPVSQRSGDIDHDHLYLTVDIDAPSGGHALLADCAPDETEAVPAFWEFERDDRGKWLIVDFAAHETRPSVDERQSDIDPVR